MSTYDALAVLSLAYSEKSSSLIKQLKYKQYHVKHNSVKITFHNSFLNRISDYRKIVLKIKYFQQRNHCYRFVKTGQSVNPV